MPFVCTRSKTKDDLHRNVSLEKRISDSSTENMDLSNMNLTDQDVTTILQKGLKKKKCTSLSLSTNKITPEGIQILVDGLRTNKKLTHLILSANPIGDEGVEFLSQLLKTNASLNQLSLNDTGITDRGLKILIDTLQSNATSLRCLDLRSNTAITDASVEPLLLMAEQNQTLSACRLDNCGLTQGGKDRLREAKSIRW